VLREPTRDAVTENEAVRSVALADPVTSKESRELVDLLRWNAARLRSPAHLNGWPDWMTERRRLSMADHFENYASEIDADRRGSRQG
jgi:hypothetical protein